MLTSILPTTSHLLEKLDGRAKVKGVKWKSRGLGDASVRTVSRARPLPTVNCFTLTVATPNRGLVSVHTVFNRTSSISWEEGVRVVTWRNELILYLRVKIATSPAKSLRFIEASATPF